MPPTVDKENLEFDESELSKEDNKELYVFQWLCKAEKALKSLSNDDVKLKQQGHEETVVKIITGASPFPPPGRPVRTVAARVLVLLYVKGDTKTMYETLQNFVKLAGDVKLVDNDAAKIACLHCIAELMTALSGQIASFMTDIALLGAKLAKSTSNPILLRYQALTTMQRCFAAAAKGATEAATKEVIKQARILVADKAYCIQRIACELLMTLFPAHDPHRTTSEIESMVQLCAKQLDAADLSARQSLAALAAHMLASSQIEKAPQAPDPKKSNKGKEKGKGPDNDIDDLDPPPPISTEAPRLIMSVSFMLGTLSAIFNRPSSSRKTRIGLFDFYIALLTALGPSFVENNYASILKHLMENVVTHPYPRNMNSRHDILIIRHGVSIILRDRIAVRMLSEQGQIGAIRELAGTYLKRWPALMPGEKEPPKETLVVALREVAGLVAQMGNAPPPVQDALAHPLTQLLAHPSHSVRVATAWALRSFCFSTPLKLPKMILNVLESLQKDINAIANPSAPADIAKRTLGHAYGLAALFAVIPERPLYVSYDLSAKVLDMSTQLLRKASEHDLHVADVEIEVAWTCIASLMALGPNFVKAHLPQLLVLWRNALPKPASKDTSSNAGRDVREWMFLLHVRECALGAISAFLKHNSPTLVTLDVTRRLSSLLSNAVGFANAFLSQKGSLDMPESMADVGGNRVTPITREASLRRRAYDCFSMLGFGALTEATQGTLLQTTITLFATSEGYAGSAMQAAIASSGGAPNIWHSADSYGYGITSLCYPDGQGSLESEPQTINVDIIEKAVDNLHNTPVLPSCEHDTLILCDLAFSQTLQSWPDAMPPTSAVVDSSMVLFSQLIALQEPATMVKHIKQLAESVGSSKLEKNMGRKAAVFINATMAILMALRTAMAGSNKLARDNLGNGQVASAIVVFLKEAIIDSDPILRIAGSEAIGRIASLAGTNFLASQMTTLYETIRKNREPGARAGCALTYGAIHTYVGGLAAGPLLKTTVDILVTLSNDPHPVVHYWALHALGQVINAASLSYSPFISGTLGLLFNAYSKSTHEVGGGILSSANLRNTLPTHQALCQIIDGVVTVLGPELQEPNRTRSLILELVGEFNCEGDDGIKVEAIKCIQHFLLFSTESIDIADMVGRLRLYLSSPCRPLKLASINALYQLVQKDALMMSTMGGDQLVEDLFRMLDEDATVDGVRNIILSWLQQTASLNPSAWIDLCQRIMSKSTAAQEVVTASVRSATGLRDEEGESLGASLGSDQPDRSTLMSRWRTQLFALQCLHNICSTVARSGRREHLDLVFARSQRISSTHLLVSRVNDLIKMAFTASAAYVTDIRLEGLVVLRDIIETFSSSPDPDYVDAPLLEQHQAPITAALTPAFSSDSTPEILASAIQVCGVFVGSGIIKEITRMGRILKLLTSALEQSKDSGMLSIGDAKQLSPNASVMLRIATATAWAELEISSHSRSYLRDIISPYHKMLSSLWMASLRDYASIRGDSEMLQDSASATLDSSYLALGREVLLPYYNNSWAPILNAVANAMDAGERTIMDAMDGGESLAPPSKTLVPKEEPRAMFFVLFGLVYETLASSSSGELNSTVPTRENATIALQALKSLVQPQFCGSAIFDPPILQEFNSLCYRIAITESAAVQLRLVDVVAALARTHRAPAAFLTGTESNLPPDAALTHCLRICGYILRQNIPSPKTPVVLTEGNMPQDRIDVLTSAFLACTTIGHTMGRRFKEEVRTFAVALYSELLKSESCDWDIVGPTLPALKALLEFSPPSADEIQQIHDSTYGRLVHGLLSSCLTNIDDMRGREGIISRLKVKNNLLVAALVLTVAPASLSLSKPAVEYYCSILAQKLAEPGEISLTAAHCCKTLLLTAASPSGNPIFKHCTHLVISGMIRFIAHAAADQEDTSPAETERQIRAVDEVLKSMSAFVGSTADEHKARLLGVILPSSMLLMTTTGKKTSPLRPPAIKNLLALATVASAAFKEAAGRLDAQRRADLEGAIREAVAHNSNSDAMEKNAKPTIALKSF